MQITGSPKFTMDFRNISAVCCALVSALIGQRALGESRSH